MDCVVHEVAKSWTQLINFHFASVWEGCNCAVVWMFFGNAFLGVGMKADLFQGQRGGEKFLGHTGLKVRTCLSKLHLSSCSCFSPLAPFDAERKKKRTGDHFLSPLSRQASDTQCPFIIWFSMFNRTLWIFFPFTHFQSRYRYFLFSFFEERKEGFSTWDSCWTSFVTVPQLKKCTHSQT